MAETTIVPFASLPACATLCGHLYDANGACVPPAASTAALDGYASCFCSNTLVSPFSTGSTGVCDSACTTEADGLASIQTWFASFCSSNAAGDFATTTAGATTGTTTGTSSGASSTYSSGNSTSDDSSSGESGGQAWLSSHWRWVVFIVVVVVGIAGIWIGAAIWRRRYLRKRDRQIALGKSLAARSSTGASGGMPDGPSQSDVYPHPESYPLANTHGNGVYATEKDPGSERRRFH